MLSHFNPSKTLPGVVVLVVTVIAALATTASATPRVVFQDAAIKMGYLQVGDVVSVSGYKQCATSIGDYLYVRSGNTTNIHPFMSVDVSGDSISIRNNEYANGNAAYVCHNDNPTRARVLTGYVASGTRIEAGLSCVMTIAGFTKNRAGCSGCGGSVSCAYDPATGTVTASQTELGDISHCGYVCVDPRTSGSNQYARNVIVSRRYATTSGTDNIGAGLSVAIGANQFGSTLSGMMISGGGYDSTSGQVAMGSSLATGYASFSYVASVIPQCSDGVDNDGDGRVDAADPGCSNPDDNDESGEAGTVTQCGDGIDNDMDGMVDAFKELNPQNGQSYSVGAVVGRPGVFDPALVQQVVETNMRKKGFKLTIPTNNGALLTRAISSQRAAKYDDGGKLDTATLNQVCRILGYRTYVSSTCRDSERSARYPQGKCSYHSPEDNGMWRFVNGNFTRERSLYRTWIASITCRDALAACNDGWDNDGDGLVDRADPGCSSDNDLSEGVHDPACKSPDSPTEFEQCRNGKDDDSDGLIDMGDPGCSTPSDDNESDGTTQCQDARDNDTDGLTDMSDPGCSNPQDNNESDSTSQCQDGKDNDADGATDHPADFSCSSKLDNDEADPKSQCQNGLDDDGDGLTDSKDPGCPNPQDNNESDGTAQCQDGQDNDGDGLIDVKDPGCSSPQDNDESDGTSQCQDKKDNDADGLSDSADPGCPTPQDNDESDATSQCQDGKDNDADGLIDAKDPGCSSPQDNDESDGTSQCQDKKDNDADGLIDLGDPGCVTLQDNDEADGTSQCQDSQDNDSDGLIDAKDPGCTSPQDNNESDGTTQCQDTKDNDADGLVDAADPGCSVPQDNDESDGTAQCQDGKDNDSDGATDYPNDFSCSSKQDNDESNPKSQCQNGADDDSDGLVDARDPGCSSNQDNNEADATTQCQDGIDNDSDGAKDFPADFSCADATDNDEANPKSQCQNALDDDSDGLIDSKDPGCSTAQDNNEADGTAQCQDTKDNDADGLIDAKDPGCSSPQDNEESDGTTQCQDTKDNDADGLIDAKDPGCSTPQDNDESDGTTQCQDTKDNDADGLIDAKDPGCSSPQDNDESDEAALLTVGVECLTVNNDGSKIAYFSYNNTSGADLSVTTNANLGTVNEFATTGVATPPPTAFKTGIAKGTVVVTFTGDSLTWLVRAQKSAASRATASATTPVCAPITPKAECRDYKNGVLVAQLGYVNGNSFEQQIPVGASNGFVPSPVDRGQPTKFFAGTNKAVFQVPLASASDSLAWVVNGVSVKVDGVLPVCSGGCVDTPTGNVTAELDAIAQELSNVMTRAANVLASAKVTSRKDVSAQVKRNRTDAERAKKKAQEYEALAKTLTIRFPQVVKTCPQAPVYCETVDRQYEIESLKGLYANQRNSTQRTIARSYFRNTGRTSRTDSLVKQAKQLEQQGLAALSKLPRFETECK